MLILIKNIYKKVTIKMEHKHQTLTHKYNNNTKWKKKQNPKKVTRNIRNQKKKQSTITNKNKHL